jgi:hypothetical protein
VRRECGGLKIDQAKRLKELERENERLKKAVSELTLNTSRSLKEALSGKYCDGCRPQRNWRTFRRCAASDALLNRTRIGH